MFNPDEFLQSTQITEANSTESIPVPVGEYAAVISDVKVRQWSSKDGSASGLALDIIWDIEDDGVKAFLDRPKVTVKQGIMLDLTETGGLDTGKGKNVALGRLREAVGRNTPGQPFSFPMLTGCMAKVAVNHRISGEQVFAEVKGVAKM